LRTLTSLALITVELRMDEGHLTPIKLRKKVDTNQNLTLIMVDLRMTV